MSEWPITTPLSPPRHPSPLRISRALEPVPLGEFHVGDPLQPLPRVVLHEGLAQETAGGVLGAVLNVQLV